MKKLITLIAILVSIAYSQTNNCDRQLDLSSLTNMHRPKLFGHTISWKEYNANKDLCKELKRVDTTEKVVKTALLIAGIAGITWRTVLFVERMKNKDSLNRMINGEPPRGPFGWGPFPIQIKF